MKISPSRARNLLRLYGLTADQWLELTVSGRCPLCEKRYSSTRHPVVDHDHRTGLVRGSPCAPCNYRLGTLFDDAAWLRRAADYLTNPPATDILGAPHYVPGSPQPLVQVLSDFPVENGQNSLTDSGPENRSDQVG